MFQDAEDWSSEAKRNLVDQLASVCDDCSCTDLTCGFVSGCILFVGFEFVFVTPFLVPAYPGSPGQRAIKRVCVCVLLHPQGQYRQCYLKPPLYEIRKMAIGK